MELIFNLVKGDVSDYELNAGGGEGQILPSSGNQLRSAVRPHITKSYFETYWHERSASQSVAVQAVDWQRR